MEQQRPEFDADLFLAAMIPGLVIGLALGVFTVVAMWRLFTKAGQPGWAAIVPFYNTYVLLKIVGRPGWWLVLFFIPIVNIVFLIFVMIDLAKAFGKDGGFAVLLIFLPYVGMAILGFGPATYFGPVADPAFAARYGGYPPPGYPQQYGYPPQPGYPPQYGYPPPQQYPPQPPQQYPPQQYPPPHQQPPEEPEQR